MRPELHARRNEDPGHAPGFCFSVFTAEMRYDGHHATRHAGGMEAPTDLQALGRAFLDALVTRLGHHGAVAVLLLLAAEVDRAGQCEPADLHTASLN
jgi:hypothetical protein